MRRGKSRAEATRIHRHWLWTPLQRGPAPIMKFMPSGSANVWARDRPRSNSVFSASIAVLRRSYSCSGLLHRSELLLGSECARCPTRKMVKLVGGALRAPVSYPQIGDYAFRYAFPAPTGAGVAAEGKSPEGRT
jgi:hypothetical protein